MKSKLLLTQLLYLMISVSMADQVIDNSFVGSRSASNKIFVEQNKLIFNDSTPNKHKLINELNNSMINSRLASNVIFTAQNNLNVSVDVNQQNDSNRNNSMVNPLMASST